MSVLRWLGRSGWGDGPLITRVSHLSQSPTSIYRTGLWPRRYLADGAVEYFGGVGGGAGYALGGGVAGFLGALVLPYLALAADRLAVSICYWYAVHMRGGCHRNRVSTGAATTGVGSGGRQGPVRVLSVISILV